MLCSLPALDVRYGRSYMDHILALSEDTTAPEAVRLAAKTLLDAPLSNSQFTVLRTVRRDTALVEATKDILAHSLAIMLRSEPMDAQDGTAAPT
jgi:hypothetical protein